MARTPKQTAVGTGVDESEWRSLHPITPLARVWAIFAAIIAYALFQNGQFLRDVAEAGLIETYGLGTLLIASAGALVAIILIAGLYSWLSWRRMGYAITNEAVYLREGILFRSQKHARLDRIQAVNISHPLIGRIFKLGNIVIEVAGGVNSNFRLGLLKNDQLEAVRREVMVRAKTARMGAAGVGALGAMNPGAQATGQPSGANVEGQPTMDEVDLAGNMFDLDEPEHLIYRVPTGRLLASTLIHTGTLMSFVGAIAFVAVTIVASLMSPAAFWGMLPLLLGAFSWLVYAFNQFATNYGFQAAVTADGIRIRSGLLSTHAQTIPVHRIHGVRVSQSFFWRFFGWYRVSIVQAGFAAGGDNQNDKVDHSVFLPVGDRDEMLRALWMVYPNLGVDNPIAVINEGIDGEGTRFGFTQNSPRTKIFDPLVWRRRAVKLTDVAILIRNRRITHDFSVIPYEHLQSTRISQGPWERKRGVVTLDFHMVQYAGFAQIAHLDAEVGKRIHAEVTKRALVKREQETQEEWAKRTAPVAEDPRGLYVQNSSAAQPVSHTQQVEHSAAAGQPARLDHTQPAGQPDPVNRAERVDRAEQVRAAASSEMNETQMRDER